jgi:hypothetical protein
MRSISSSAFIFFFIRFQVSGGTDGAFLLKLSNI